MTTSLHPRLCAPESPLFLVAGPCALEDEGMALEVAQELARLRESLGLEVIFKASYDKANRTHLQGFRGPGLEEGLRILERIREQTGLPILSDVHTPEEARRAGEVLDVIQIPAFLCRQTDLLVAAARSGRVVNIKKGQFLAPWDMAYPVEKVRRSGNPQVLVTERGTCFGYNNLVVDFRTFPILKKLEVPVVFDATHSVQLPGGRGTSSGGQREYAPILARAAVAAGCDGLFLEVHPDPSRARSDRETQVPLAQVPDLIRELLALARWMRSPKRK